VFGPEFFNNLFEEKAKKEEHVNNNKRYKMGGLELIRKKIESYMLTTPLVDILDPLNFVLKGLR